MKFGNLNLVRLLLIVLVTSSCATHLGYLSSNAVIVDNNFRIIGIGVGESESIKIFGFGGLKKDALVFDAKKDLYKNIELKSGQALTNITVDLKNEYYIVYSKLKVIVTAEIVDFNTNNFNTLPNNYELQGRHGYKVGEIVYVKINGSYTKRKIERLNLNSLQIELLEIKSNISEPIIFSYDESFRLLGDFIYNGIKFKIGDTIEIIEKTGNNPSGNRNTNIFRGIVAGLSVKYGLLYDNSKKQYKVIDIEK